MVYVAVLFAGLIIGALVMAAYYSAELYRLADENSELRADMSLLRLERNRYRDAQDVFKTKQKMNWGA